MIEKIQYGVVAVTALVAFGFVYLAQERQMDASKHKKKSKFFNIALDPMILLSNHGLDEEGKAYRRTAIRYYFLALFSAASGAATFLILSLIR